MVFIYKVQYKNQDDVILNSKFTNARSAKSYVDKLRTEGAKQVLIYKLSDNTESPVPFEFLKKEAALVKAPKKRVKKKKQIEFGEEL